MRSFKEFKGPFRKKSINIIECLNVASRISFLNNNIKWRKI